MIVSKMLRALAIGGATVAVGLLGVTSTAASVPVKPTPSCKVPVFSVSQTTAIPGTKIKVSGLNFSGCSAQGNPAKPTAVLTVKVGVITAAKVTEVLATTKTSPTGSFSVQITIPNISAGGQPKIILAAAALDPVTKLSYEGIASIAYSAATTTAPTPSSTATATPTSTTTPTATASTSSTNEPTSSSVDVPTAVPAGSGGFGAPTGSGQIGTEVGLGAAGVALVALGGLGLSRRRVRQH